MGEMEERGEGGMGEMEGGGGGGGMGEVVIATVRRLHTRLFSWGELLKVYGIVYKV